MSYIDYTISYRDKANNPRDITGLTYEQAQKHAKQLIKSGVIWLEVYKGYHRFEKVYDFSDYNNKPDSLTEIIRNKADLEKSKLPDALKKQLSIFFYDTVNKV